MWEAIGGAISAIGSSIVSGIQSVGNFLGGAFNAIVDFVGNAATMVSDGVGWVIDGIKGIFSGNADQAAEAVNAPSKATGMTAPVADTMPTQVVEPAFQSGGYIDRVKNAMDSSSLGAKVTQDVPIAGASGGSLSALAAPVEKVSEGGAGAFEKVANFFKTDLGQMVGKGAQAGLSYLAMQKMTKNQQKLQESMEKRQAQREKEAWLKEEQRRSQLTSWEAQRANEVARAQANNQWSGFTGKWINPTTEVPMPNA